jgi:prephenate dehydrogenase
MMTVKITIIGLGKIGTSMGLALAKHTDRLYRIGHDLHPENARRAQKMGAMDKLMYNLPASVEEADLVLLTLPVDQIRATLEFISPDLKEGAVVMDTAPVKQVVAGWAQELLKPGRYYVGLCPAINAQYILDEKGELVPRADLFEHGAVGIVSPSGTDSAAIKLATDFVTLLGATPIFMDMMEVDSLMAAVHILPQLLSASLANITINQAGWLEGRKLAGVLFAQASNALVTGDTPEALLQEIQVNQEHVTRLLDSLIEQLMLMREATQGTGEDLMAKMKLARERREEWLGQRMKGDWPEQITQPETPTTRSVMQRWFWGRRGDSN